MTRFRTALCCSLCWDFGYVLLSRQAPETESVCVSTCAAESNGLSVFAKRNARVPDQVERRDQSPVIPSLARSIWMP